MAKKAKTKKVVEKKAKKDTEKTAEEHQKEHGPDVKRLLEEYEQKEEDFMGDEELVSENLGAGSDDDL